MPHILLVLSLLAGCGLAGCGDTPTPEDAGVEVDAAVALDAGPPGVDAGPGTDAGPPMCGPDERTTRLVYFGTEMPTEMPLTPEQVLAVVDFGGCSGAFVTDEWVLTAGHCGIRVGRQACVGMNPLDADVCFTVDRVEDNPSVDMALVHVDARASSRIPELVPIRVMTEMIDPSWIGRIAEAAGYGTQEDDSSGEREFTAEPIDEVGDPYVVIDGMGTRGVCFGDSGGPLMVLATDSTVRVLGVLSFGDPSCVGRDSFTRADLQAEWIGAIIGPTPMDGAECGRITQAGDCMGTTTAVWCDMTSGTLTSEVCSGGTACGWDDATAGYRCVTDDPCGGVSAAGACQDGTAVWCDSGTVRRRGCSECAQLCRYVSDVGGFYCRPDPCLGLDPMNTCDGNLLTTCDPDDGVRVLNCEDFGRVCGYSERRMANRCVRP